MDTITLEVQTRNKNEKAKDLLKKDLIPIEYYGHGVENKSFQVDYQTFRKVFRKAGYNTIIDLVVDGKDRYSVIVQEIAQDPVSDKMVHVDLINVRTDEELHTAIPLEFTGIAPAVKELAGVLVKHLEEIDVKCLPKDLIHSVTVDLSVIVDFNSYVRVKDLKVPATIHVLNPLDDVVVTAVPPRAEEEEVAPAVEAAAVTPEGEVPAEGAEPGAAAAATAAPEKKEKK